MTEAYSLNCAQVSPGGATTGMTLHEGVYAGLLGSQYETPRKCEASLVSAELSVCRLCSKRSRRVRSIGGCAFSCLTNWLLTRTENWSRKSLETGKASASAFAHCSSRLPVAPPWAALWALTNRVRQRSGCILELSPCGANKGGARSTKRRSRWKSRPVCIRSAPVLGYLQTRTVTGATKPAHTKGVRPGQLASYKQELLTI